MNFGWTWRNGWGERRGALRGYAIGRTGPPTVLIDSVLTPSQALTLPAGLPLARLSAFALWASRPVTVARSTVAVAEVQSLAITGGTPVSGSFRLLYGPNTSGFIAWNASAATVQGIIEAVIGIGVGNVVATGGPLPGTPITLTYATSLGNVANPVEASSTLSIGTAVVSITAEGVAGSTADTITLRGGVPRSWRLDSGEACPFTADVSNLTITNPSATRTVRVRLAFDLE